MVKLLIAVLGVRRTILKMRVLFASLAVGGMTLGCPACATDLSGAWATDTSSCNKVFVKKGDAISFQPNSDQYGGGFILEENRVRAQMQTCNIKARKEDGNAVLIC